MLTFIIIFLLLEVTTYHQAKLIKTSRISLPELLHLNIRSMNKNFEAFQDFYKSLITKFSIICLKETWANDSDINHSSLFQLEGYIPAHQIRKSRQGGGIVMFIRDSLLYKLRNDLSINCEDIECLSIEILNSQTRNIIFNVI